MLWIAAASASGGEDADGSPDVAAPGGVKVAWGGEPGAEPVSPGGAPRPGGGEKVVSKSQAKLLGLDETARENERRSARGGM